jgi:hypothetical protein
MFDTVYIQYYGFTTTYQVPHIILRNSKYIKKTQKQQQHKLYLYIRKMSLFATTTARVSIVKMRSFSCCVAINFLLTIAYCSIIASTITTTTTFVVSAQNTTSGGSSNNDGVDDQIILPNESKFFCFVYLLCFCCAFCVCVCLQVLIFFEDFFDFNSKNNKNIDNDNHNL